VGLPPTSTTSSYADNFDEVKSFGIGRSTTASSEEASTGQFCNGAIQNHWNEITQTGIVPHKMTTEQSGRLKGTFTNGVDAF
jgi:hypothetical protein